MDISSRTRIAGTLLALSFLVAACTDRSGTREDATITADDASTAAAVDGAARPEAPSASPVSPSATRAAADPDAARPDAAAASLEGTAAGGRTGSLRAPVIPAGLPDDIPFAKMGQERSKSLLDGIREYEGIEDPERESVYTGRREVEPIRDYGLEGAFESPEILAQTILDTIFFEDSKALHSLRLTKPEFEYLVWTEFPQSRPATNIQAGDAWGFHDANCHDGVSELLEHHGGTELHLVEIKYTEGLAPYTNFNIVKGVVIWAVDDRGNDVFLDEVPTFIERNGRWKVYMYKS